MKTIKIAIIGLGYVGLPLARLFATKYPVVGYDINTTRIDELQNGHDSTLEVEDADLQAVLLDRNPFGSQPDTERSNVLSLPAQTGAEGSKCRSGEDNGLFCTKHLTDIQEANVYIITVPTPVDKNNRPVLTPLYKSSAAVGSILKKGDTVVYESTVYPGMTEEECVPVLEKESGLTFNQDFFVGYSPERINPGDKEHTVEKILKVTAGSTPEIGEQVDALYKSVITAGTYLAPSIKVAEAAKVIENSQRDINIAFVNELAKIFNLLEIDTHEVLKAAGTKWNFLPFTPGLVGGHCIGVDPYYLAQKAQEHGYHPEIILAGRRLNDSMGDYVASQVVKTMIRKDISIKGATLLMLGITFKENCPDVRNTKIVDVVHALQDFGIKVTIYDPLANPEEVMHEYGLECHSELDLNKTSLRASESERSNLINASPNKFDAIVLGVAHKEFLNLDLNPLKKETAIVYDVKGILPDPDMKL